MKHFPKAEVEVDSDLLGAARAVCGYEPGIACILGTGANSCLYDGKKSRKIFHHLDISLEMRVVELSWGNYF